MHQTSRARPTVVDYLCEFIRADKTGAESRTWVAADIYERMWRRPSKNMAALRLKPLFIALEEKISYDDIRVVVAH